MCIAISLPSHNQRNIFHRTDQKDSSVPWVELGVEDGGRETEAEVHISRGYVPEDHIPVCGRTEEFTTTAVPAVYTSYS